MSNPYRPLITKEHTLPSGILIQLVEADGAEVCRAIMQARNEQEVPFAIAAAELRVEGKKVIFEDFMKWPKMDFLSAFRASQELGQEAKAEDPTDPKALVAGAELASTSERPSSSSSDMDSTTQS